MEDHIRNKAPGHGHAYLQAAAVPVALGGHIEPGGAAIVPLPGVVFLRLQCIHLGQLLGCQGVEHHAAAGQSFLQIGPEGGHIHILLQKAADIADAAADGLGALGAELLRVHLQGPGHHVRIGVKEQGAVVEDTVPPQPLGRAGDLAPLHQNIVAAGGLRLQAQALQCLHHRLRKPGHA